MAEFSGFPSGKVHLTPIPATFFSELLPEIDHLGELKVVLYAIWKLDHLSGDFRYLRRGDFASDQRLMAGLGKNARQSGLALDDALERAVMRGVFLTATVELAETEIYYFLNSPKGRAAVEAIRKGGWRPTGQVDAPIDLGQERPNVFALYEQNIGPLTPMMAEELRDAEAAYPAEWLEDAVRIAVENNKRSWRYIDAILRRWQEQGRDEQNRRDTQEDRRRYAEWGN